MVTLDNIGETSLIRDRVYDVLKRQIIEGGFKPGETLNIVAISKQLNVSNAPVREALNLLSKDGLVDLEPYKKATVALGSEREKDVALDLRHLLEPYAARDSINNIPKESIEEVRELLNRVLDNPDDYKLYFESDLQTHELLYKYSTSTLLVSILDAVRTYSMRYYSQLLHSLAETDGRISEAITGMSKEHLELLDAAEARDADRLEELLKKHINSVFLRSHNEQKEETEPK